MESKQIVLQMKYARLIDMLSQRLNVSREQAMELFFHSTTMQLIQDGVADLHCHSDIYLVDELERELQAAHA